MMCNFIKKTDEGRTIVVTSQFKAAFWNPLSREVPACHRAGQRLLFLHPDDVLQISTVLASLKKKKSSIRGILIQKIEAAETNNLVDVVGIAVSDGNADLFLGSEDMENGPVEVIVTEEMLHEALFNGDAAFDLEELCNNGPFKLKITVKGSEIIQTERGPSDKDSSSP